MQEQIIVRWDDLHLAKQGQRVEAVETISIGIDGNWYELDLTADNAASITDELQYWASCGRETDTPAKRRRGRPAGSKGSVTQYNREMRAWGDKNGLEWHKSGNTYKHSEELVTAYAAHLAARTQ